MKRMKRASETPTSEGPEVKKLYRCEVNHQAYGAPLDFSSYPVLRTTPKGYWIAEYGNWIGDSPEKWVSATARKRFAYPTKEEAFYNYLRRTQRYIKILKAQTRKAESGLSRAVDMIERGDMEVDIPPGVWRDLKEMRQNRRSKLGLFQLD